MSKVKSSVQDMLTALRRGRNAQVAAAGAGGKASFSPCRKAFGLLRPECLDMPNFGLTACLRNRITPGQARGNMIANIGKMKA